METDERNWGNLIFDFKASVIPAIIGKVLIAISVAAIVTIAFYLKIPVGKEALSSIIPELVLGLLLVFRTDTAYSRFWEGSQIISDIIDFSRGLARQISVNIDAQTDTEATTKLAHIRLVGMYLAAVKQHVRYEGPNAEMQPYLSESQFAELEKTHHMPNKIAQWLSDYFREVHRAGKISDIMLVELNRILDQLTLSMGSCERILTTPLPRAYAIHLKHLLLIYCFILPFKLVGELQWGTPIAVGVIAFALLGIEEIGLEIENPFGYDPNDLPLDQQCKELRTDIEAMVELPVAPPVVPSQWVEPELR
jgi:putative membrane protein